MDIKRQTTDCNIVGGGPGGLFLALLMAKRGKQVVVMEKQKQFGPVPGGAILQPGTLAVFRQLGLLKKLRAGSQMLDSIAEYDRQGMLFSRSYRELGQESPVHYAIAVPLMHLRQVLLEAIEQEPNIQLLFDAQVNGLPLNEEGRYELNMTLAGKSVSMQPRIIVGADGKFSTIRELADISADIHEFAEQHLVLRLPRPAYWPTQIRVHYSTRFLLAVPTHPNSLHVFWPVTAEQLQTYRAEGGVGKLRKDVAEALPGLQGSLQEAELRSDQLFSATFHTIDAAEWHKRNVVLMGDCAHGVHPFGGQGMNMALQDAALLSEIIKSALDSEDLDELSDYERIRHPYVRRFQHLQHDLEQQLLAQRTGVAGSSLYSQEFLNLTLGQAEIRSLLLGQEKNQVVTT